VVSLSPSATEVVAALGAADYLVGVDDYSTFPPEVTRLPRVGNFLSPDVEAIVRLRPTLVVVDDIHAQAAETLGGLGLSTLVCPMHGIPDVKRAITAIGQHLGRAPRAAELVAAIDHAIDDAAAHRPARKPRVLALIDRTPGGPEGMVAAGAGSWIGELLAIVGGDNVLATHPDRYPRLSREEVIRAQPEVIFDIHPAASAADPVADWASVPVPAVTARRVLATTSPYLTAPSPRIAAALAELRAALGGVP
jgi:iron complex transport system substrate-binding protein